MQWMKKALCKGKTEMFFPNEEESRGSAYGMYMIAKKICKECPVRSECLRYALDEQLFFGVFGGKTPRERRDMYRESLRYR